MLFLQHVTTTELTEIDSKREAVMATTKIDISGVKIVAEDKRTAQAQHHRADRLVWLCIDGEVGSSFTWSNVATPHPIICIVDWGALKARLRSTWGRIGYFLGLPRVALAIPVPHHGVTTIPDPHRRLSALLPLPNITGFQPHTNVIPVVTSSRGVQGVAGSTGDETAS